MTHSENPPSDKTSGKTPNRTPDQTPAVPRRLHVAFAAAALALLAAVVWMFAAEQGRQWREYQRTYRDEIELTLRPGGSDGPRRPLEIEQIWLPELTLDYHFQQVARFDRCTTCHQGTAKAEPAAADLPRPFASHPRLELFVSPSSPHPVERFGCTICHDGQGSATEFTLAAHTPNDRRDETRWRESHGWSREADWPWPMPPRRFAESRCLRCHMEVTDLLPSDRFPDPPAQKLLAGYDLVRRNGCFGCHVIRGDSPSGVRVGPDLRLEPEGAMRKLGPSLRAVGDRLEAAFIERWIANPRSVRPSTRMPQFHGQHEHLEGQALADARRFEAVERRALSHWLLAESRPVEAMPTSRDAVTIASAARGRRLFETQGCLACHRHDDFPLAAAEQDSSQAAQGPDLSRLGEKYVGRKASIWLTDWLADPARHSPRTLMPNSRLEPAASADIAAFLLASDVRRLSLRESSVGIAPALFDPADRRTQEPGRGTAGPIGTSARADKPPMAPDPLDALSPLVERDLDELALLHLTRTFSVDEAERFLAEGAPAETADRALGDAVELRGPITLEKKLRYVGRRTIAKRGCFGCHDLPGFDSAAPIGPELSDWGRRSESLLALNHVDRFVDRTKPADADAAFFRDLLRAGRREGFLWQKLRAPRSFDYQTTAGRDFNSHLTMGRFAFTPDEIEAISTFVLGLVAQPPTESYVCRPTGSRRTIAEGRRVLTQYACDQCHVLAMRRWSVAVDPKTFDAPEMPADFEFLRPRVSREQIEASTCRDAHGLVHAELIGMPQVDEQGQPIMIEGDEEDAQGNPLPMWAFSLWRPAAIDGKVWPVGGPDVLVYDRRIVGRREPDGGSFARRLYPIVLAEAKAAGAHPSGMEAWGWCPPPLVDEGAKVRPDWLRDFLLEPTPIRPAAALRMPKFSLSPDDAAKLADYFAAAYGPDAPSEATRQADSPSPSGRESLDAAMRVLLDRKTFCARCHVLGDDRPEGSATTVGPDLETSGRRLKPEYLRRWLANPKTVLPYAVMPVNFPPTGPPLGQDLFPGTSLEQLDAMVDLLRGYEQYRLRRTPARTLRGPSSTP